MEFTGRAMGVSTDFLTGKMNITLEVNEASVIRGGYDRIKNLDKLSVKIVKYREKRSLDSNAYAWALMTKIAAELGSTKDEIYEDILQQDGFLYEDDEGFVTMNVKSEVDMRKIPGHWRYCRTSKDGRFKSYLMIKGSSEYDTKEMSHFVNIIVEKAKELGIDTMTPEEIRKMNERWGLSKDCGQS